MIARLRIPYFMTFYILISATCMGGDSCCKETNKCDVGEGDCDRDKDCLEGLLCGFNNCPLPRGFWDDEWDRYDDCCYKSGNDEFNKAFVIKKVILNLKNFKTILFLNVKR